MSLPTARTLAVLHKEMAIAQVVEKYIKHPNMRFGRRIDLFGFIDLVYMSYQGIPSDNSVSRTEVQSNTWTLTGVQCCAGSSHATRRTKIMTECKSAARIWLMTGARIEIRSWSKRKVLLKNGNKTLRWTERIENITLEDIAMTIWRKNNGY